MKKEKDFILLLLLLFFIVISINAKELKIVFWTETVQNDLKDDIAKAIKDLKDMQTDLEIRDSIVVVNNEESETQPNAFNDFCSILSTEGTSLIIDLTYFPWKMGLNIAESFDLPYLRINRLLSPFLQMFGEFLRQKAGNDVVLIFQNEQDKNEALFHMVEGFPFRTLLINAIEERNFVSRLLDLRPTPAYYAVFAKGNNMNAIFEKLTQGELFKRPDEWHFIFLDTRDNAFKYADQAGNSTKFVLNSKSICHSMEMQDSFCDSGFTFHRALLVEVFRSLSNYLKSNDSTLLPITADCAEMGNETFAEEVKPLKNIINNLKFSDFITLTTNSFFEDAEEYQAALSYAINVSISTYADQDHQAIDLANWQANKIVKINQTISAAKRFFRIGTTEAIPWSYLRRDKRTNELILSEDGKPIWEGYCIDFVKTLAEKLNFDYELITPAKGKFGERNVKTGQWDGIVGDLVSGETDFAVTALKMYSEREEVIDFIAPYFEQTGISIVMRKPVRQTSLFKFMTVLRLEVWLSIIGALVATAVMIWLLDKYSPYSSRNNPEAYPYPCREFTLRESFWFALTSFTPQGGGEAPKAVSGRILVAAYWLFVVLMLATFTANLAAFLTVERMQTPVQNLEQLARQSRINYTVVSESDTHQYFINMKFAEDTLYRMWKELALNASEDFHKFRIWDYPIKEQYGHILLAINASVPVKDSAEGFRKVNERENADFAFIHDSSEIKYEITQNCNLTEVGEVFAEQPYAIAVQQGSHLTDELSYAILELQKDRYFEELKGKYWNHSLIKECSASEDQEGITLESLGGVFIATLFGLGLAMITLAVEVFYYKKREAKRDNYESNLMRSLGKITKVRPFEGKSKTEEKLKQKQKTNAWHTKEKLIIPNITPPPSFESATYFRGRKIPASITLGGEEFKPRRLGAGQGERDANENKYTANKYGAFPDQQANLPPYMD